MSNLNTTPKGVQLVYTNYGAGCLLVAGGILALSSLLILFVIVPSVSWVKAFFGIVIGGIGLLFFGGVLLRIITVLLKGRVLIEIEDGYIMNRKQRVPLAAITDLQHGWHSRKLSGMVFEDLIVTTTHKTFYFRTYNLLSAAALNQVIEEYILPHATQECRDNWAAKKANGASSA